MADFGAMNAVWEEWIGGANAPTRATGEVRLATPDYKVEVIVTAALTWRAPRNRCRARKGASRFGVGRGHRPACPAGTALQLSNASRASPSRSTARRPASIAPRDLAGATSPASPYS